MMRVMGLVVMVGRRRRWLLVEGRELVQVVRWGDRLDARGGGRMVRRLRGWTDKRVGMGEGGPRRPGTVRGVGPVGVSRGGGGSGGGGDGRGGGIGLMWRLGLLLVMLLRCRVRVQKTADTARVDSRSGGVFDGKGVEGGRWKFEAGQRGRGGPSGA